MIMQGAQCMCVRMGRVVAVVTGLDSGEEEVQSGRVRLGEEGCMDGNESGRREASTARDWALL